MYIYIYLYLHIFIVVHTYSKYMTYAMNKICRYMIYAKKNVPGSWEAYAILTIQIIN